MNACIPSPAGPNVGPSGMPYTVYSLRGAKLAECCTAHLARLACEFYRRQGHTCYVGGNDAGAARAELIFGVKG